MKHDIPWNEIHTLFIENLDDMKRGKNWGKQGQHWIIGYLIQKLYQVAQENAVQIIEIPAAYTSQTCIRIGCGHISSHNRHGIDFECEKCGDKDHADHVGSVNVIRRGVNSPLYQAKMKSYGLIPEPSYEFI